MKKVLTVLLAIAVVFTFSFGSTVAFAADESYTLDQWSEALQAEKTAQLGYLETAKAQALNAYSFNNEGFVDTTNFKEQTKDVVAGYSKAALTAAADAVIEDLTDAMDKAIRDQLNKDNTYPTDSKPDKDIVSKATILNGNDCTTKAGMTAELEKRVDKLEETQAPLTKQLVLDKLNALDASKYNDKDKNYDYTAADRENGQIIGTVDKNGTKLTAADVIQAIRDDAKTYVNDADKDKNKTDAQKRLAYEAAYAAYDGVTIPTLADEDFNNISDATDVASAVDAYAKAGYDLAKALFVDGFQNANNISIAALTTATGSKEFWDENTKNSKDGKFFDVAVVNNTKVTKAEATAIYNAMVKAINDSKTVVTAYANNYDDKNIATKVAAVEALYKTGNTVDQNEYFTTLDKAGDAADKYADVVKEGTKLKNMYYGGIKQYNDAKVDEAVKKAEDFVYGDLKAGFKDNAKGYIVEAAADIYDVTEANALEKLMEDNAKYGYTNFRDAIDTAAEKMYVNGLAKGAVTKKVSYGADKTAEADLVYLKGTYAAESADDWDDIASDTIDALKDAQSYAEIESIMKKAAEDFGKLLKEDDRADVVKARDAYKAALPGFIKQNYELLDKQSDYSQAYAGMPNAEKTPLYDKGEAKIDDANTVDAVKVAYAEAQALVTGAKSDDELKDMKKAVEKKIDDLPALTKLTAADKDAVKAAYDAYAEYIDLAGAKEIANLSVLEQKYDKVIGLVKDAIDDEAEALVKKIDEVDNGADENLPKYTALKAEINALVAKGEALKDEVQAVKDDGYIGKAWNEPKFGDDYAKVDKASKLAIDINDTANVVDYFNNVYKAEIENAKRLLNAAIKPGATAAQIKVAVEAYNALTERQQLELNADYPYYLELEKLATDKDATAVKELKITAKSTAKKGSITVKWTVKGSADIDGYEVWKSTKHSKGYKKAFTTKKQTYKNTKGLKKGTRYYYKVRAYKMVEGKKITSDWSNKARRVAK